ncbi:hypothetical protein V8C86DRAFT_2471968 [Haematococcus lacustris]
MGARLADAAAPASLPSHMSHSLDEMESQFLHEVLCPSAVEKDARGLAVHHMSKPTPCKPTKQQPQQQSQQELLRPIQELEQQLGHSLSQPAPQASHSIAAALCRCYNGTAMRLLEQRLPGAALQLLEKAQVLLEPTALLAVDPALQQSLRAVTLNNMGCCYRQQRALQPALRALQQAAELESQGALAASLADSSSGSSSSSRPNIILWPPHTGAGPAVTPAPCRAPTAAHCAQPPTTPGSHGLPPCRGAQQPALPAPQGYPACGQQAVEQQGPGGSDPSSTLLNLAAVLSDMGRHREALQQAQAALHLLCFRHGLQQQQLEALGAGPSAAAAVGPGRPRTKTGKPLPPVPDSGTQTQQPQLGQVLPRTPTSLTPTSAPTPTAADTQQHPSAGRGSRVPTDHRHSSSSSSTTTPGQAAPDSPGCDPHEPANLAAVAAPQGADHSLLPSGLAHPPEPGLTPESSAGLVPEGSLAARSLSSSAAGWPEGAGEVQAAARKLRQLGPGAVSAVCMAFYCQATQLEFLGEGAAARHAYSVAASLATRLTGRGSGLAALMRKGLQACKSAQRCQRSVGAPSCTLPAVEQEGCPPPCPCPPTTTLPSLPKPTSRGTSGPGKGANVASQHNARCASLPPKPCLAGPPSAPLCSSSHHVPVAGVTKDRLEDRVVVLQQKSCSNKDRVVVQSVHTKPITQVTNESPSAGVLLQPCVAPLPLNTLHLPDATPLSPTRGNGSAKGWQDPPPWPALLHADAPPVPHEVWQGLMAHTYLAAMQPPVQPAIPLPCPSPCSARCSPERGPPLQLALPGLQTACKLLDDTAGQMTRSLYRRKANPLAMQQHRLHTRNNMDQQQQQQQLAGGLPGRSGDPAAAAPRGPGAGPGGWHAQGPHASQESADPKSVFPAPASPLPRLVTASTDLGQELGTADSRDPRGSLGAASSSSNSYTTFASLESRQESPQLAASQQTQRSPGTGMAAGAQGPLAQSAGWRGSVPATAVWPRPVVLLEKQQHGRAKGLAVRLEGGVLPAMAARHQQLQAQLRVRAAP